jgi:hypothetical protein
MAMTQSCSPSTLLDPWNYAAGNSPFCVCVSAREPPRNKKPADGLPFPQIRGSPEIRVPQKFV